VSFKRPASVSQITGRTVFKERLDLRYSPSGKYNMSKSEQNFDQPPFSHKGDRRLHRLQSYQTGVENGAVSSARACH
jgi:hypothetical protein